MEATDDIINAATSTPEKTKQGEPPKKKRRRVELEDAKEEGKGIFSFLSAPDKVLSLRRDLKRILCKYPDLDLREDTELDEYITSLDEDQLKSILDAARFKIGTKDPNGNGLSFLGITGDVLERMTTAKGLTNRLMADEELVGWIEELVPSDMTWLSTPFRIINRIINHIQASPQ